METITDITDIISQNNIIKTSYEFGISDENFYTVPIIGIGIFTIILLLALIVKKHRWALISLAIASLVFSMVYGAVNSMKNVKLVATTYTFRAGSERTIEKVEKYIGRVTYDENHDVYTVTQYNRKGK